jgi:hypothetical protein
MGVSLYIYYSVGGTIPCSAEWTLLFFFSFFFSTMVRQTRKGTCSWFLMLIFSSRIRERVKLYVVWELYCTSVLSVRVALDRFHKLVVSAYKAICYNWHWYPPPFESLSCDLSFIITKMLNWWNFYGIFRLVFIFLISVLIPLFLIFRLV